MGRDEQALRDALANEAASVRVGPVPIMAVQHRGTARRDRRRIAVIGAALTTATVALAVPMVAPDFGWSGGDPATGVNPGTATTSPPPSVDPAEVVVLPMPLDAATSRRLTRECMAGFDHTSWHTPTVAVRYPTRTAVIASSTDPGGPPPQMLVCEWDASGQQLGGSAIGGFCKCGATPSAQTPVRRLDSGGDWDGATYSAVFRIAESVGSVTVKVNGGRPHAMAIADGFGYVAAVAGNPQPQAEPSMNADGEQELNGEPFSPGTDVRPPLTVVLTAYDPDGALLWTGTIDQ
jgi:hypothetical protein